MPPIYDEIGDSLLLFYQHYQYQYLGGKKELRKVSPHDVYTVCTHVYPMDISHTHTCGGIFSACYSRDQYVNINFTGWWFEICCFFHPGMVIPTDDFFRPSLWPRPKQRNSDYFFRGWNHQPIYPEYFNTKMFFLGTQTFNRSAQRFPSFQGVSNFSPKFFAISHGIFRDPGHWRGLGARGSPDSFGPRAAAAARIGETWLFPRSSSGTLATYGDIHSSNWLQPIFGFFGTSEHGDISRARRRGWGMWRPTEPVSLPPSMQDHARRAWRIVARWVWWY